MSKSTKAFVLGAVVGIAAYHVYAQMQQQQGG